MSHSINYRILGIPVFSKKIDNEVRSVAQSDLQNPSQAFLSSFGFNTYGNEIINEDIALTLSAVWSCVRVLSETLAMLPLNVYNIDSAKNREIASGDTLNRLLHDKPNGLMTSFTLRETMQFHISLTGNAYCIIHRDWLGKVESLELIPYPKQVLVLKSNSDGQKYFQYLGKVYSNDEILHIAGLSFDGLKGISPISYARESIGSGVALQTFGAKYFKNGARPSGVVEYTGKLDDKVYEKLKTSFQETYSGLDNVGKTVILEGGGKYVAQSLSNEDSQYLVSRKFSIEEIARIFRVPLHMINSLEHATNNNIEHQGIEFATYTMTPHVVRWEQELNSKLISSNEAASKYIRFSMNELSRGDSAARSAMYKELFYTGSISPNEIRGSEEMNHYEGGDKKYIPTNMLPSELSGKNITNTVTK